ncbi:hypothetical protein FOL47_010917 [Perkinsus chesapeaki]|uniref:Uncharacterized protein n=1 Tax=Perkinsus chesapeaki TaxID=330153 RepID=A0A7J6N1U1_PERCH|nr:hypothetical protein FOL47_010917 [Perkinsus chesapeaki]
MGADIIAQLWISRKKRKAAGELEEAPTEEEDPHGLATAAIAVQELTTGAEPIPSKAPKEDIQGEEVAALIPLVTELSVLSLMGCSSSVAPAADAYRIADEPPETESHENVPNTPESVPEIFICDLPKEQPAGVETEPGRLVSVSPSSCLVASLTEGRWCLNSGKTLAVFDSSGEQVRLSYSLEEGIIQHMISHLDEVAVITDSRLHILRYNDTSWMTAVRSISDPNLRRRRLLCVDTQWLCWTLHELGHSVWLWDHTSEDRPRHVAFPQDFLLLRGVFLDDYVVLVGKGCILRMHLYNASDVVSLCSPEWADLVFTSVTLADDGFDVISAGGFRVGFTTTGTVRSTSKLRAGSRSIVAAFVNGHYLLENGSVLIGEGEVVDFAEGQVYGFALGDSEDKVIVADNGIFVTVNRENISFKLGCISDKLKSALALPNDEVIAWSNTHIYRFNAGAFIPIVRSVKGVSAMAVSSVSGHVAVASDTSVMIYSSRDAFTSKSRPWLARIMWTDLSGWPCVHLQYSPDGRWLALLLSGDHPSKALVQILSVPAGYQSHILFDSDEVSASELHWCPTSSAVGLYTGAVLRSGWDVISGDPAVLSRSRGSPRCMIGTFNELILIP